MLVELVRGDLMMMMTLKFVVAHKAPFWCFGIWYRFISAGTPERGCM